MNEESDPWIAYTKDIKKLDNSNNSPPATTPFKKTKILHQGLSSNSTIDLHGLTQDQAFERLEIFLINCSDNNIKEGIIITGKGQLNAPGVIKLAVPRWLEYTELKGYIFGYSWIQDSLGGSGSIRVIIKRRNR
jgi:DNA-nicking Smr family endonuclease